MAKVKYIKLSDALEMLQKRNRDAERHFSETGYPISFINAAAYGEAIKMLKSMPTVEMEERAAQKKEPDMEQTTMFGGLEWEKRK